MSYITLELMNLKYDLQAFELLNKLKEMKSNRCILSFYETKHFFNFLKW